MRTQSSFGHLNAKSHSLILEDNGDSINNAYAGIGFAMDYDLVLELFGSIRVRKMFFRKSVVPPTIPSDQKISVLLESTSQSPLEDNGDGINDTYAGIGFAGRPYATTGGCQGSRCSQPRRLQGLA